MNQRKENTVFLLQALRFRQSIARFAVLSLVFSLSVLVVPFTVAQDETEPETPTVLQLLALVPDDTPFNTSEWIGFSDFNAAVATRSGLSDYESWAEFQADLDADEVSASLLLQSLPLSGFPGANYLMVGGPDMPDVMGFDFFDIDAAMTFNQPPEQAFIFQGDFDADQIDTALTNNGYTSEELDGFPYWCSEDGCDTGMEQDLANRNVANLFGGDLGRRFPVALLDGLLAASSTDTQVEAMAETYQDEGQSLADDPDFQTAVNGIYNGIGLSMFETRPQLRQAYFIPSDAFGGGDPLAFLNMDPEQLEQLREQLLETAPDPLPIYQLVVFADLGTRTEQFAQVVLVYDGQEAAETAAAIIPRRIESMTSIANQIPLQELFEDRGAELLDPVVYEDETTGQYAAVLTFRYDAAPVEDENGRIVMSGMVYQLLVQMAYRRDTLWLASDIVLPE
jgi:hypothetical protein